MQKSIEVFVTLEINKYDKSLEDLRIFIFGQIPDSPERLALIKAINKAQGGIGEAKLALIELGRLS